MIKRCKKCHIYTDYFVGDICTNCRCKGCVNYGYASGENMLTKRCVFKTIWPDNINCKYYEERDQSFEGEELWFVIIGMAILVVYKLFG